MFALASRRTIRRTTLLLLDSDLINDGM